MRNRALLSAIAVCFAAAGCDSQKTAEPPKPKTAQAVVPVPPEAPKAAAASAQQDAKPMQAVGTPKAPPAGNKGCAGVSCVVKVKVLDDTVTPCKMSFTPDDLWVFGPNTLRWTTEGGWLFDTDGVVLPTGNNQFSHQSGAGTGTYSWMDANTDKNKYKYSVNLKKGTKKCKGDPSVVNGADSADN